MTVTGVKTSPFVFGCCAATEPVRHTMRVIKASDSLRTEKRYHAIGNMPAVDVFTADENSRIAVDSEFSSRSDDGH